jgi:hypothetical protein
MTEHCILTKTKENEISLPDAGMIEKKKKIKQDSENTCRALPQGLLHAPRGYDVVRYYTDYTRPLSEKAF